MNQHIYAVYSKVEDWMTKYYYISISFFFCFTLAIMGMFSTVNNANARIVAIGGIVGLCAVLQNMHNFKVTKSIVATASTVYTIIGFKYDWPGQTHASMIFLLSCWAVLIIIDYFFLVEIKPDDF